MIKRVLSFFGLGSVLHAPVRAVRTPKVRSNRKLKMRPIGGSLREVTRRQRQLERGVIRATDQISMQAVQRG